AIVTLLAAAVGGPVGVIVAIVAAVVTIIASIIAIVAISDAGHGKLSKGVGEGDPGGLDLHTVGEGDAHAGLQGQVAFSGLMPGMTPTLIVPMPDGLVIGGTLTVPPHAERSLQDVGQTPFGWDAGYSCSSNSYQVKQIPGTVAFMDPSHYALRA